jgi:hypothetical protein
MQSLAVEQRDHPLDLKPVRIGDDDCLRLGRHKALP